MSFTMLSLLCGVLIVALTAACGTLLFPRLRCYRKLHNSHPYPLPPSPPGERFFGHAKVVPCRNPEVYYQQLSKKYGKYITSSSSLSLTSQSDSDVLYFKNYQTPVIVLNSVKAADELLSKRGANYSSRPRFVLFEV